MSKKFTFLILLSLLFSNAKAQNSSPTQDPVFIYVSCPDINFEKYKELDQLLKTDTRFAVETACIPAHVLTVRINSAANEVLNLSSDFERFRNLCFSAGMETVNMNPTMTKDSFEAQCKSARRND
jgi:hypothetical protein